MSLMWWVLRMITASISDSINRIVCGEALVMAVVPVNVGLRVPAR